MKKLLLFPMVLFLAMGLNAQGLKGLFKDPTKKDSTGKSTIDKMIGGGKTSLTNDEIISGLKEALSVGSNNAGDKLSKPDGFFKDQAIKILMPEEAKKVES